MDETAGGTGATLHMICGKIAAGNDRKVHAAPFREPRKDAAITRAKPSPPVYLVKPRDIGVLAVKPNEMIDVRRYQIPIWAISPDGCDFRDELVHRRDIESDVEKISSLSMHRGRTGPP